MDRKAYVKRETKETRIEASLNLDCGACEVNTGIGFFDHMLELFAKHAGMGLTVEAKGDLHVDCHHTVEDVGIVIGKLLKEAAGDKEGIKRYGHSVIPMDEALSEVVIDFSGRSFFVLKGEIPCVRLGEFETETVQEFFTSLANNAGMNLHIIVHYGTNTHHIIESVFKAFAHALRQATSYDPNQKGVLSTKGVL
ncbi:MAG: imidazoleglycerol-phosphate dehydratase HisB [Clostridiaceae bacterium]|nr:imidazoleglycerol-phosphate dehydratase HisB [Clostridiaceae bacterium]